jgi:hypothetical protein
VRDFVLSFSKRFKQNVVTPTIKKHVLDAFSDSDFIKKCLISLIEIHKDDVNADFTALVSDQILEELYSYFYLSLKKDIDEKRVVISSDKNIEGFNLKKKGNNYFWDFTAETITMEIASLVEPVLRKYFVPTISESHNKKIIQ